MKIQKKMCAHLSDRPTHGPGTVPVLVCVIGASLSEPHTSGKTRRIFLCLYISIVRTHVVLYIRDSRVLI